MDSAPEQKQSDDILFEEGLEQKLYRRIWKKNGKQPRAVVFFVHGLHAHGNPKTRPGLAKLADKLVKEDCFLYIQDHMGHGQSEGLQGLITGAQQVKADVLNYIKTVILQYPNVPFFVMGESLGGLLSVLTGIALQNEKVTNFKGVILIAPACESMIKPAEIVVTILTTLSKIGPSWGLGPGLEPKEIWTTQADMDLAAKDNYRYHGRIRLQTGHTGIELQNELSKVIGEIEFPVCTFHGAKDGTVPVSSSEMLINKTKTPSELKKIIVYPDSCHDLLHDPETEKVLQETVQWINERLK